MAAFEIYLVATFTLSVVQLRHQVALYRLILQAPKRWPKVYEVVRRNLASLVTFPSALAIGVTGGLWAAHSLLRRFVWSDVHVTAPDLFTQRVAAATVGVIGLAMVVVDGRALIRAGRFRPPRYVWLIDVTEWGLKSESLPILGRLAAWRVRVGVARRMPIVHRWMWRRSGEIALRVLFGLSLWTVALRAVPG